MEKLVEDVAAQLADRIESVAFKIIEEMPRKLQEANLQQLATALGICVDKARVLRERANDILKVYGDDALSDEQRAAAIIEILNAARAREAGEASQGSEQAAL